MRALHERQIDLIGECRRDTSMNVKKLMEILKEREQVLRYIWGALEDAGDDTGLSDLIEIITEHHILVGKLIEEIETGSNNQGLPAIREKLTSKYVEVNELDLTIEDLQQEADKLKLDLAEEGLRQDIDWEYVIKQDAMMLAYYREERKKLENEIPTLEAEEIRFLTEAGEGIPVKLQLLDADIDELDKGSETYLDEVSKLREKRQDLVRAYKDAGLTWIEDLD